MSEPLYKIGQRVAICTPKLEVIIPATVVTVVHWIDSGLSAEHPITKCLYRTAGGWAYSVADSKYRFAEPNVRPYRDDDYDQEAEDREVEYTFPKAVGVASGG